MDELVQMADVRVAAEVIKRREAAAAVAVPETITEEDEVQDQ